jgi:fluoroquinolone transport system permease protein
MKSDPMLLLIAFAPVLVGFLFWFGVPFVEVRLINYLALEEVISPYYGLLDLFLVMLTPSMFSFVVAMIVLEEADDQLISYLAVTPLGKTGYLFSRFGLTGILSLIFSFLVFALFHLTAMNSWVLVGVGVASAAQGICTAMLIVTFSANKVEGMAIGKFTMLFTMGALAPYFISGKAQYILSGLPSFWLARAVKDNNFMCIVIALFIAVVWIALVAKRFTRKVF